MEQQIRSLKGEEQETAVGLFVILARIIGLEETVVGRLNMIDIMENKVLGPAILRGEATMLARQMEKRFGTLPEWVTERLVGANESELLAWGERVLSVQTLNDVFKD